jgi:hypothetical protein
MKHLYELHTAVWLHRLSATYGRPVTLGNIPDDEVARIAAYHIDTVWLMGVWERSPIAADISRHDAILVNEIHRILPDMSDEDIIGSSYAIKSYSVDPRFGGETELAMFRQQLAEKGIGLILDFVPNHTAFDHDWLSRHPEYYIATDRVQATEHPEAYRTVGNIAVAKGADPHLPPWPDVAQLNGYSVDYRHASIETLRYVATLCDGVRCDMAMLLLNDTIAQTWGKAAGIRPREEYWRAVIDGIRPTSPRFIWIAECYWDTERHMLELGFDYCYDKRLYDYMVNNDQAGLRSHIEGLQDIAPRLMHFLENHDEPRAATIFDLPSHGQHAQTIASLPGPCLWYDGQFLGYRTKLPTHIRRGPVEHTDCAIKLLYENLLTHGHAADALDIPQSPPRTDVA